MCHIDTYSAWLKFSSPSRSYPKTHNPLAVKQYYIISDLQYKVETTRVLTNGMPRERPARPLVRNLEEQLTVQACGTSGELKKEGPHHRSDIYAWYSVRLLLDEIGRDEP